MHPLKISRTQYIRIVCIENISLDIFFNHLLDNIFIGYVTRDVNTKQLPGER